MNYRKAVLMLGNAEDRQLRAENDLAKFSDVRNVDAIHVDLAALPDATEMGSVEVQNLLEELASSTNRQSRSDALQNELLQARKDVTQAKVSVADARKQLLPGEEVDDETIAVLHEMLDLPPSQ
jgi:predicted  nucleic acid-binding Zn-ribbon protein